MRGEEETRREVNRREVSFQPFQEAQKFFNNGPTSQIPISIKDISRLSRFVLEDFTFLIHLENLVSSLREEKRRQ